MTGIVFSAILFLAVREQRELQRRASDEERNKLNEEQFQPSSDATPAAVQYTDEPPENEDDREM